MKNKHINNGFNPKIAYSKDLKYPSKQLIETIQLIKNKTGKLI